MALLDKPTKTGDYGLAVVEKVFENDDHEPRELLLKMARPAKRNHPYPLDAVTTKPKRFKPICTYDCLCRHTSNYLYY